MNRKGGSQDLSSQNAVHLLFNIILGAGRKVMRSIHGPRAWNFPSSDDSHQGTLFFFKFFFSQQEDLAHTEAPVVS